ncbi:GNAT family N-acetyltransferase [Azospirillum sp. sgz302134]
MPDGSFALPETENTRPARTASRHDNSIRISIASGADDMQRCVAIRAIVFLSAPGSSYNEQFGENDFSCTHLLAWVGDEPVGTLRLRWLAGEARFERLAIREEYRSLTMLRRLIDFAMRLIASKGYSHASGLTRERALRFWTRRGAVPVGEPVPYHEEALVPIRINLAPAAHPTLAAGPGHPQYEALLLQPESRLMETPIMRRAA